MTAIAAAKAELTARMGSQFVTNAEAYFNRVYAPLTVSAEWYWTALAKMNRETHP